MTTDVQSTLKSLRTVLLNRLNEFCSNEWKIFLLFSSSTIVLMKKKTQENETFHLSTTLFTQMSIFFLHFVKIDWKLKTKKKKHKIIPQRIKCSHWKLYSRLVWFSFIDLNSNQTESSRSIVNQNGDEGNCCCLSKKSNSVRRSISRKLL